jgi:hypothetical protein
MFNALYHARVLDVDLHPLAVHIHGIKNLDEKLKEGSLEVVDVIWKSQGTRQHYFSFATKFCSWHNQEAYTIYDTYMWESLCAYRAEKSGFNFKDAECKDCACFHVVVKRFQAAYDLRTYSLKNVDKFLWLLGYELVKAKQERKAHYASTTINLRLASVRRLAYEAADCGLLSADLAAGIGRVKGAKRLGVPVGN